MYQSLDLLTIKGELTSVEEKNAPNNLFYCGNLGLLTEGRRVSVVGSRKISQEGIIRATSITKKLVEKGFIVVSGLAEGADTVAHTTAIREGGSTIAVLGTPLDQTYPAKNKALLDDIKTNHLAISQFNKGTRVFPSNFPARNRTMALISDATIIVEATENSGTQHQGWEAIRLGRSLFFMQNILDNKVPWSKEMLNYGAQTLRRDNLDDLLDDIPYLTAKRDFAF